MEEAMNTVIEYVYTRLPHDVFTDKDIAQLSPQSSGNSRYGLIKRALKRGEIIRIRRGLYCLAQKYQRRPLNHFSIAQLIYGPSYISLESALSYHGWIPEGVFTTASVSMPRSRAYKTMIGNFVYMRVAQERFYEMVEYIDEGGSPFFVATPLKALCDYIYVYKKPWVSVEPLKQSLRVDDEMFGQIKKDDLDMLYVNYRNHRVKEFLSGVRKDLGV